MNINPADGTLNTQMSNAIAEFALALDQHSAAAASTERARRDETTALNRVNEAQKKIDALTAELKKQAPRGSDWRRPKSEPAV